MPQTSTSDAGPQGLNQAASSGIMNNSENSVIEVSLYTSLLQAGITAVTIDKLISSGYSSWVAVKAIEMEDVEIMGIHPLAQKRLLVKFIKDNIRNCNQENDVVSVPQPNVSSISTGMWDLGLNDNNGQGVHNTIAGNRADLDPLIYLGDKRADFLDIVDFVPNHMSVNQEQVISQGNGVEIVIKSGPKRLKIESVSPTMWTAANSRILSELLKNGKLATDHIGYYLAYTVKVCDLAQRYTWQSVLLYDREYRRLQATFGFPWGSDTQHLNTVHLRPKWNETDSKKGSVKTPHIEDKNYVGGSQVPICRLYNHSVCTYGSNCKYRHLCVVCQGNHPQSNHIFPKYGTHLNKRPTSGNDQVYQGQVDVTKYGTSR
jgi:hypothetical protein